MLKQWMIVALLICSLSGMAFAQARRNAYQIETWSPSNVNGVRSITFPYESRDLIIMNNDTDNVWVDVTGKNNQCAQNTSGCMMLFAQDSIELYDFATSQINIITALAQASPITVVVTY